MLLRQQEEVVLKAQIFEEIKALGNVSLKKLCGARVGTCRQDLVEESTKQSTAFAADREALILELRENLSSLANAFG